MATLSLIAEPLQDWEAELHIAAARDLTEAIASTAPRGCSARYLIARGADAPHFDSPRIAVEALPLRAASLPLIWQSAASARPLDGEMTHSITPLMPLRSRTEDDGSQSTVTVPNSVAWEAPGLFSPSQARLFRAFLKRAVKHADMIITGTHATAALIQKHFGSNVPVQVIPPSAPAPLVAGPDAAERRERLGLPERYIATTANDDALGRLQWIFDAYTSDPSLPTLALITGIDPEQYAKGKEPGQVPAIPAELADRIVVVPATDLADVGATLDGAELIVQPQSFAATGYTTIAALIAGVPVLHAGPAATEELVVDAGLSEPEAPGFIAALSRLCAPNAADGTSELEMLAVRAQDRGRTFSWRSAAWQLWETHAAL